MKSKIVIFESNKLDGKMSKNPKFYPKKTSEKERFERFHQDRLNLGNKLGVDGNHILRARQKGLSPVEYPDGKYILLNDSHMTKEDYFFEDLPADILVISEQYPKVIVANPCADCPILICEDRNRGYTALAHCGAPYIDRKLPQDTIKSLFEWVRIVQVGPEFRKRSQNPLKKSRKMKYGLDKIEQCDIIAAGR